MTIFWYPNPTPPGRVWSAVVVNTAGVRSWHGDAWRVRALVLVARPVTVRRQNVGSADGTSHHR